MITSGSGLTQDRGKYGSVPVTIQQPVLVVGNDASALELLRLATVRSDDVRLASASPSQSLRRFCERMAIDMLFRKPTAQDFKAASAVLIARLPADLQNTIIRLARQASVPVHVVDRRDVSDFSMLEFLESQPLQRFSGASGNRAG